MPNLQDPANPVPMLSQFGLVRPNESQRQLPHTPIHADAFSGTDFESLDCRSDGGFSLSRRGPGA